MRLCVFFNTESNLVYVVPVEDVNGNFISHGDFERHIKEPEWLRSYITVLDISNVFDEYAQIRCALKR